MIQSIVELDHGSGQYQRALSVAQTLIVQTSLVHMGATARSAGSVILTFTQVLWPQGAIGSPGKGRVVRVEKGQRGIWQLRTVVRDGDVLTTTVRLYAAEIQRGIDRLQEGETASEEGEGQKHEARDCHRQGESTGK